MLVPPDSVNLAPPPWIGATLQAPEGLGERVRDALLIRIVRANEEIKAIVSTAFKINLMALNAIFLAKRAGSAALGFGVLSNELRRFSEDLTREMTLLGEITANSVGAVSSLMLQRRLNAILTATVSACADRPIPALAAAVARGHEMESRLGWQLGGVDKRLQRALADTKQLVELGAVLARSAKIEAAYGGAHSQALMQVSSDFAAVIERIKTSLEKLAKDRLSKDR